MTRQAATYDVLRQIVRCEESATVFTWVGPPIDPAQPGAESPVGRRLIVGADGELYGSLGSDALDALALSSTAGAQTTLITLETSHGPVELFLEILRPPPKLVIVGAVHVAIHLVHFAKRLGFRCVVVDARAAFATPERFSHADELVVEWPSQALAKMPMHDETYCVFLTHDPKLDDPALEVALRRDARYVGALGSKRTHAKRVDSLRNLGLAEDLIARIHAPIGLDLGGRKPEEIALSIAAQLVASRHGKET